MSQITTWDEFPTIEYVPGVFRQAVCGEKVMMTKITYKPGVFVPEHKHEAEQIMLIVKGELRAKVGDEEKTVIAGDLLIIASNEIHSFRNLSSDIVIFHECFAPIRLEYLIGFKGPDPSLQMMKKGLQAK
jgi:quercetin dioxygenase-like cupin family protein